ncbi:MULTISPECIES: ABC transporter ATP-binding protein [unclassified Minwuia]|jgi:peptide/nickel transport system ATP-binding protein|uniref:ABC transporter ATP-binding protein n=1 Tax=unclassified Minwuia TaxID=2618799 RepID=UPI00247902EC|nr:MULTISPECIES: ABC transporter ATP-binding protein [unclassified Minwuia]
MSRPLLELTNVSTHFHSPAGRVRAVDGVSVSLEAGQTLGLVGESGSGKSVLARTIMGLLPSYAEIPKGGAITFDGQNLLTMDRKARRAISGPGIGMIFQDPMTSLNPVMKIGQQVYEGMRHHFGTSKATGRQRAIELLTEVGIPQPDVRVDQYPHQLSGGMRQRVAIAIALACEPKLLIADEPTTALDVTVQSGILDLLQREQRDRGMTLILITHDLGVVAGRCDKVAVMYAGGIVETGSTRSLFARTRMRYTQALLDSIPRLDRPPHERLKSIGGRPPNLITPPPGCRFAPRCAFADAQCEAAMPPMQADEADPAHSFACWHPRDPEQVTEEVA